MMWVTGLRLPIQRPRLGFSLVNGPYCLMFDEHYGLVDTWKGKQDGLEIGINATLSNPGLPKHHARVSMRQRSRSIYSGRHQNRLKVQQAWRRRACSALNLCRTIALTKTSPKCLDCYSKANLLWPFEPDSDCEDGIPS